MWGGCAAGRPARPRRAWSSAIDAAAARPHRRSAPLRAPPQPLRRFQAPPAPPHPGVTRVGSAPQPPRIFLPPPHPRHRARRRSVLRTWGTLPRCSRGVPSAPAQIEAPPPRLRGERRTPTNLSLVCMSVSSPPPPAPATLPPADRAPRGTRRNFCAPPSPPACGGTGLRGGGKGGGGREVAPRCPRVARPRSAARPPPPKPPPSFPARCCRTLNYTPSISRI